MRRILLAFTIVSLVVAASPAHASHRFGWADLIVVPRIDVPGDPDMLARCDHLARGKDARIWFGFMLELPEILTDGTHTFTLTDGFMGGTPDPNYPDVTFFSDLGSCEELIPPTITARHFGPDPKGGIVPPGSRFALMTIAGDSTSTFVFETSLVIPHGCREWWC